MERIPTGIEALDELLQGGFPQGAAILVVGCPGSGKTVMAHQIMFNNAAPEFKALYLTTLAEPQVKVLRFQQHEPRLVVIDTIRAVSEMIESPVVYREFLLELSLRLATWNASTIFLGEYAESEIELRPESAIVDGIIYLSGMEEKRQQKRYLRILKMRGTAFSGGENFFQITRDGIDLFPRPQSNISWLAGLDDRILTGVAELALCFAMAGIERGDRR